MDLRSNKLINTLSRQDFNLIADSGTVASLAGGTILCDAGQTVAEVYFPLNGVLSLFFVLMDRKTIVETATTGRDGVFGAMAGLRPHVSAVRAVVQLPSEALRIPVATFRELARDQPAIAELCINYDEVLLSQARINAACNALHKLEARLGRGLLRLFDLGQVDKIQITQDILAAKLGVRRTSVTEAAMKLQSAGAISYGRGTIKIVNRSTLKGMSCECHETMQLHAPIGCYRQQ
jgi:CRP-like cAMP-binding protein